MNTDFRTATGRDLAVLTLRAMGTRAEYKGKFQSVELWEAKPPRHAEDIGWTDPLRIAFAESEEEAIRIFIASHQLPDFSFYGNLSLLYDWSCHRWEDVKIHSSGGWSKAYVCSVNATEQVLACGEGDKPHIALCRAICAAHEAGEGRTR